MAGATGLVHYMLGGAGYTVPIGQIIGGRWGEDINPQERGGIGGVGVIVPGAQITAVECQFLPIDVNCLIDKILRASYPNGALSSVPLEAGDDERGLQSALWNVNRAEVVMETDAALQLNLAFLLTSGKHTRTSGAGDHSGAVKTTFEWYRGHCKIGAADAGIRRTAWTVENRIVPFYSLNEVAAASQRFPEYGVKGNEIVALAVAALVETAADLTADEIVTVASVIGTAISNAGTPVTATVTSTTPTVTAWETSTSAHDALKEIGYSMAHDPNSGNFSLGIA